MNVSRFLVEQLHLMGIKQAFGIVGGGIAYLYDSIAKSPIELYQFCHESGAAFAATEAYFSSGRPTILFTTTGPGILNGLTGINAAKSEGAKVIMLSGASSPHQRGRWAIQETSNYTYPNCSNFSNSGLFDFAAQLESIEELEIILQRLIIGINSLTGFVAYISLPASLQSKLLTKQIEIFKKTFLFASIPSISINIVKQCAELLRADSFVIWIGYGAINASKECVRLAKMTGARVICSPRAKGIFPEDDPLYIGVSGIGGHETVIEYMVKNKPARVLVLGSRLGEATSSWDKRMIPRSGFIHVDLDPRVSGSAFPQCETLMIQAEIGSFVTMLIQYFVKHPFKKMEVNFATEPIKYKSISISDTTVTPGRINPKVLMSVIQSDLIDNSDTVIMSECGHAFIWANHYLSFSQPGRYRTSTFFGSMGHFCAGVVGSALALQKKIVAIVGDGSFLMQNEVSTAVKYNAPAVWIILNDGGYGICRSSLATLNLSYEGMDFYEVDFVAITKAQGGDGITVTDENMISHAINQAICSSLPFILDVKVDPKISPSFSNRIESIRSLKC